MAQGPWLKIPVYCFSWFCVSMGSSSGLACAHISLQAGTISQWPSWGWRDSDDLTHMPEPWCSLSVWPFSSHSLSHLTWAFSCGDKHSEDKGRSCKATWGLGSRTSTLPYSIGHSKSQGWARFKGWGKKSHLWSLEEVANITVITFQSVSEWTGYLSSHIFTQQIEIHKGLGVIQVSFPSLSPRKPVHLVQ